MIIKKYNLYKESLNENEITLEKFANDLLDVCDIVRKSRKPNSDGSGGQKLVERMRFLS